MTSPSEPDPLLSVPQFATKIGVSAYTVRKWIKGGKLPAVDINIGGKLPVYRIPESELEEIVKTIRCAGSDRTGDEAGERVHRGTPDEHGSDEH
jgi:excisionase family DNA binding protein